MRCGSNRPSDYQAPFTFTISLFKTACQVRQMSKAADEESDAEFDARYESFFNRTDIDGWEIRKAMADLGTMDLVPEPRIVAAALRACRRVNDYSLTTRILELIEIKTCGKADVWAYMLQVRFQFLKLCSI